MVAVTPSLPSPSTEAGSTVSASDCLARWTSSTNGSPDEMASRTIWPMETQSSQGCPATLVTASPASRSLACASDPSATAPMTVELLATSIPQTDRTPAMRAIPRTTLTTGPASSVITRARKPFPWYVWARSSARSSPAPPSGSAWGSPASVEPSSEKSCPESNAVSRLASRSTVWTQRGHSFWLGLSPAASS